MRPGGTQKKHGAAVRMRRRLGLPPRAYVLLSCSLALVVAGVSAYGLAVPPMVQARAARELRVGHKAKSDLGTTTGYAWANVVTHVVFGVDDAGGAEAPDNEIALANGKTIVLTNTKIVHHLSDNSVSAVVNKAEQQKGRIRSSRGNLAALVRLVPAPIRRTRAVAPARAPPPVGLGATARRAVAPVAIQTPAAFRLPRRKAYTAGS